MILVDDIHGVNPHRGIQRTPGVIQAGALCDTSCHGATLCVKLATILTRYNAKIT